MTRGDPSTRAEHIERLLDATACSGDGRPIGPVSAVYTDGGAGRAAWATVQAGPDGVERFVPLVRSWLYPGGRLVVSVSRRAVEQAPVPPSTDLGPADEDALYRYYAHAILPSSRDRSAPAPALHRLPGARGGEVRLRRHQREAARP